MSPERTTTSRSRDIADFDLDDWKRLFAVNVDSMALMASAVVPQMIEAGGGSIINVSTIESVRDGEVAALAYGASKGAVNSLTLALATRLGPHGIRVNAILPGIIERPLVEPLLSRPEIRETVIPKIPLRRPGTAWAVAGVAAFLAPDDSSYVSGAMIPVDGGLLVRSPADHGRVADRAAGRPRAS